MTIIGSGAEAIIEQVGETVFKIRVSKNYRLPALDQHLRGFRTRREAKVITRLQEKGFPCPTILRCEGSELHMNFIAGQKLRDRLHENPAQLGEEIGRRVAEMHNAGIIHGDLTTSNMLLGDHIVFIDFGLSFFSDKTEDRACDLHVLRQVLKSTHHNIHAQTWNAILAGYNDHSKDAFVLKRLLVVEKRGRNKGIGA